MTHATAKITGHRILDENESGLSVTITLLPSALRALYHAAGSAVAGKTPEDPEAGALRDFLLYVEARWPEIKY